MVWLWCKETPTATETNKEKLAKSGNNPDRTYYIHVNKCYLRHLYQLKKTYINSELELSNKKLQMLFKILQQLMKGQQDNPLPDSSSQDELTDKFADFLSIRSWR